MAPAIPFIAMGMTALSAKQQGDAANIAAKNKAFQQEESGKQALASGIRKANEQRHQGEVVRSDARAAMSAAGGVTDDAGATKMISDIDNVYEYNAMSAIYESEVEDQQSRYAAKVSRWEGKSAQRAGNMKALSSLVSDGSEMYSGYQASKKAKKAT